MVPSVTIVANSTTVNKEYVAISLSWEEPFNNYNPIMNYTISCSSVRCPSNFTVKRTDNTTRNYTIGNLFPNTNYTFSVAAINSVGSGKAGRVMTTTPGKITLQAVK